MHHGWLQCEHILAKAHEHLCRRLATYAAIDIRLAEEFGVSELPEFGDGVAHEDDAGSSSRAVQGEILLAIPAQLSPIVMQAFLFSGARRGDRSRIRRLDIPSFVGIENSLTPVFSGSFGIGGRRCWRVEGYRTGLIDNPDRPARLCGR